MRIMNERTLLNFYAKYIYETYEFENSFDI